MSTTELAEEIALNVISRNSPIESGSLRDRLRSTEGALILVNKPYGETSFHVVHAIRKRISPIEGIKRVKVGHAGTLDPLATGLLIVATRGATKTIAMLTDLDKVYTLSLRLGITSAGYDLESPITVVCDPSNITKEEIESVVQSFAGASEQIPPIHSAIKQNGQPVYLRARAGTEVTMTARSIILHSIEVTGIAMPHVSLRVHCSKGTYIRSLVRDIGERLGTGAVLISLEREAVGDWRSSEAFDLVSLLRQLEEK